MHRRSLLALLALSTALPLTLTRALAQEVPERLAALGISPEDVQLINDISAYNTGITTMAGRFLQIDTQGARIEGVFYLQRPGKIRFRYNPPSKEEIVSQGRGFYILDRGEKTYYAYPQDAVPLRQFLDENIDLINANIVAVSRSPNYFAVTLSDETPKGTVNVQLAFDTTTKDLVQWVLADPSGSELTFSLYDIEKNIDIPQAFFYIDRTYTPKEPGT